MRIDQIAIGGRGSVRGFDGDGVLVLSRDKAEATRRTLVVAKNRHGETSTVPLGWDGADLRLPQPE